MITCLTIIILIFQYINIYCIITDPSEALSKVANSALLLECGESIDYGGKYAKTRSPLPKVGGKNKK